MLIVLGLLSLLLAVLMSHLILMVVLCLVDWNGVGLLVLRRLLALMGLLVLGRRCVVLLLRHLVLSWNSIWMIVLRDLVRMWNLVVRLKWKLLVESSPIEFKSHVWIIRVVATRHVGVWWQPTFSNQSVDFFLSPSLELEVFIVRILWLLIDLERKEN